MLSLFTVPSKKSKSSSLPLATSSTHCLNPLVCLGRTDSSVLDVTYDARQLVLLGPWQIVIELNRSHRIYRRGRVRLGLSLSKIPCACPASNTTNDSPSTPTREEQGSSANRSVSVRSAKSRNSESTVTTESRIDNDSTKKIRRQRTPEQVCQTRSRGRLHSVPCWLLAGWHAGPVDKTSEER